MIWIRLFVPLVVGLMVIYYIMVVLQCLTNWFKMTNREITFVRCLVPFYYWIAPVEERKRKRTSDYADEEDDEIEAREEKIKNELRNNERNTEDK